MYPWNQNPPQTYDYQQNPPHEYDFLGTFDNNVYQANNQNSPQTYNSYDFLATFDNNVYQANHQNPPQTYNFLAPFDNNVYQANHQNPPQTYNSYDFLAPFDNNVYQANHQNPPQTYNFLAPFDNNVYQANYQNPPQTYQYAFDNNQPHVNQVNHQQQQDEASDDFDPWDMRKLLTVTDVRSKIGLRLLSDFVKNDVLKFWDENRIAKIRSGVDVKVWDSNTHSEYQIPFKLRRQGDTGGGYFLTRNWYRDFVARRNLKEGDEIGISWDQTNERFNFSLLN